MVVALSEEEDGGVVWVVPVPVPVPVDMAVDMAWLGVGDDDDIVAE